MAKIRNQKALAKIVRSRSTSKAVFLDRDGTVNINRPEYVCRKEDFKFAPTVIPALQKISKTDYKIIILTNQSGIGRGYFKEKDLTKLHQWLRDYLKNKEIRINGIYYCPHLTETHCSCRKPRPGLLFKAAKDFNIDLSKSWLIGDDEKDIILARESNIKSIKLGSIGDNSKVQPNYYAQNLLKAVRIILTRYE